jgi:hypothetical protein
VADQVLYHPLEHQSALRAFRVENDVALPP